MVEQIKPKYNTYHAAGIIAFFTLLSRVVGLYRDRAFAATFGAGDILDSYNAAFRLPDFIFNLLILGTLSVAFIPVFTEYYVKDKNEAQKITNTMLTITFLGMSALCAVLYFFVPQITHLIAPSFEGTKHADTVLLTKIFLLSPIIFTISNVFLSYLSALKRFLAISLAPIFYNFGIIFGAKFLYPHFGLAGLGYGVLLGALAHMLIQLVAAVRAGFVIKPNLNLKHPAIAKIVHLFVPRIFGMDQAQLSLIIASIIGSGLASGTITIFNFANNLQAVPTGIFAISFAVAAFPHLSESFARNDEQEFRKSLTRTILNILFFILPITALIILLRAQIVRVVLGSGNFDWKATILTANALGIFAASLFAQGLTPLFARAFYARHNTKTPVIIGLVCLAINAVISYLLASKYGVLGMTTAFTVASILNMLILVFALRRHLHFEDNYLVQTLSKIILATILLSVAVYGGLRIASLFLDLKTGFSVFLQGLFAGLLGILVFMVFSKLLKIPQTETALGIVKRRLLG